MLRDVPQERNSLTNTPEPDSETNRAKRTAEQASRQASRRAPGRQPGSAYWLLVRNENGPLEVLITGHTAGEEALPVFSYEEEAEMFLWLGQGGFDGWHARESTAGELTSILYGLCASVKKVALDPLPEMFDEKTVGLVSLKRERFLDVVLGRGRSPRSDGCDPGDPATDGRPRLAQDEKTRPEGAYRRTPSFQESKESAVSENPH